MKVHTRLTFSLIPPTNIRLGMGVPDLCNIGDAPIIVIIQGAADISAIKMKSNTACLAQYKRKKCNCTGTSLSS
jgi:hypothetical protein